MSQKISYIQVPSLKLATALSKMEVPIVNPGVLKLRNMIGGREVDTMFFHFGLKTVDGKHETEKLVTAWTHPDQYADDPDPKLSFMAKFHQAIDHRDVILDIMKDPKLQEVSTNPAPTEWIEERLAYIAKRYPLRIVEQVNGYDVVYTEHTPDADVLQAQKLAEDN